MSRKGATGCSMSIISVPRKAASKRQRARAAAVKAALTQYCPNCKGKLVRMNTPGAGWFATCTKWCGYEVPAAAP
jgi:Ribonuclease G/E